MPADDELNKRFYKALGRRKGVTEKRMMGGICFMLNGNMLGGADRDNKTQHGRFMFRVGKENESEALSFPGTNIVEQGGRRMGGMIFVEADSCSEPDLKSLAKLALGFVNTLPEK